MRAPKHLTCLAAGAALDLLVEARLTCDSHAEHETPGAKLATKTQQSLPTNGTVESRIGPLAFEASYPTDAYFDRSWKLPDLVRVK